MIDYDTIKKAIEDENVRAVSESRSPSSFDYASSIYVALSIKDSYNPMITMDGDEIKVNATFKGFNLNMSETNIQSKDRTITPLTNRARIILRPKK